MVLNLKFLLGPSIKDVRTQGEWGLSSADIFRKRKESSSDAKKCGFFKIYGVSAGIRGVWASADILRTKGEGGGVNFSRFCRTSFMDGPFKSNIIVFTVFITGEIWHAFSSYWNVLTIILLIGFVSYDTTNCNS